MPSFLSYLKQRDSRATVDAGNDVQWITVKGNHIPLKEGQNKGDAIKEFFKNKSSGNKSSGNKKSDSTGGAGKLKKNSLGKPVAKTEEGVKNFEKWFKGSKAVDKDGNPRVFYHGTTKSFSVFDKGEQRDIHHFGKAFYFTDKEKHAEEFGDVMPVYLNIKKPFVVKGKRRSDIFLQISDELGIEDYESIDGRVDRILKDAGYDGIIFRQIADDVDSIKKGGDQDIVAVFEPGQIKSTKNTGEYSERTKSIFD